MKIDVGITGVESLIEALEPGPKVDKVKAVVRKYASDVQRAAMRRVPVKTGFLKRSIQSPEISTDGMTARIIPTADYAFYVEVGTRKMGAQPFMKPSVDEIREKFLDDISKVVNE